jgi:lipoprotein NlpD
MMRSLRERTLRASCAPLSLAVLLLAGCATGVKPRAPVEDRNAGPRPVATGPLAPLPGLDAPAKPASAPAATDHAGKPGYYSVKPGDTLIRIGLDNGQSWRDLARWNQIENPDRIEIGQVLRVIPPGQDGSSTAARPVASSRAESRPLESKPQTSAPAPAPTAATAPVAPAPSSTGTAPSATAATAGTPSTVSSGGAAAAPSAPAPAASRDGDDDLSWSWPAQGSVLAAFDEVRNKGVAISGKAGDAVLAAADGRVVYAGSSLRGYGNLVIIKHNETFLTAYAHNQALLVKEDQPVKRGQKVAEMGSSDAERVQLHFEIRRKGKPVDPLKLLPSR